MAGSTVLQPGSQPACSITWAGRRSLKRACQSAYGVLKTTVTVRPWLLPLIDLMSR